MSPTAKFHVSLALLVLAGCGSDNRTPTTLPADAGPAGDATVLFSDGGGGVTNPATADDCSEAAKLVYVVSAEYDLYSFYPSDSVFKKIGRLACPDPGPDVSIPTQVATPNSMAVDRSGTAWVNYSSGKLYKVSTTDASCKATSFQPGQDGVYKFGMAFSTNGGVGTKEETLYVVGIKDGLFDVSGHGLATVDLTTMKLTAIGDFSGSLGGKGAELTGTGDGKLWGFFTTSPASLAAIAKPSGQTSNVQPLSGVETGSAWAFSFWGGDFWFYTAQGTSPSSVTRLRSTGGAGSSLGVSMPNVGFRIVGAGVSTCAPLEAPK